VGPDGFFHPALADPNRRRPYSRIYSRNDVLALRTIAKLRAAGVPLRRLKPMVDRLAHEDREHWPTRSPYVVAAHVFTSRDEAEAMAAGSQPERDVTTIDLTDVLAEVEAGIARLGERGPEQIGQVTRTRGIMRGVPVIAGTRIPTETVAWFVNHGYALAEILENVPRLTPTDVEAAVAFEEEAKAPEPMLVSR
jgi:uncharacterized protein (DUF433 family)